MSRPPVPAASAGSGDLIAGLLRVVASARPGADAQLITRAYQAAAYWHRGQQRKSGDAYITHPVAVAVIGVGMGADDRTVCAALLHDVLDDTACTPAALRTEFGAAIADLVEGTRALDAAAGDWAAAAASGILPAGLPGDGRVLLIKVADRLHNMRTLRHLTAAKQVERSQQTLRVQVPLARALGADTISAELAGLASATLQHHQRPPTASGRMLCATAALLPAPARARWREEWLAEVHVLPTRRERAAFATQIMLGIGRLAVTLRASTAARKRGGPDIRI